MGLRNVVHRRNHKERSQPANRSKLGLLEKHKDYVQRAKDHHSKRDRINLLKEKAANRNKDEFYFSMINTQTRNGVHITDRGNRAMDNDVVQLLKTQDAGYLRAQTNKERRAISNLQSRIAPCVPQMRISWIEEKQHRKLSLLNAGLLPDPEKHNSISKKERQRQRDRWDQSEYRDETVGNLGKKTVWVDGDDQVRAYKPPSSKSSSSTSSTSNSSFKPSSSAFRDYDEDDSDSDQEAMEMEDEFEDEDDGMLLEEGEESDSEEEDGDFADASVDEEVARDQDEKARSAGQKAFERHLSHLLRLLLSRQTRLSTLLEASSKLSLARSLMSTKGQSVKKLPSEKEKSFLEKVAEGKLTKNGLALPGNDDDDEEDEDGETKKKSQNKYRWSKERKR